MFDTMNLVTRFELPKLFKTQPDFKHIIQIYLQECGKKE